MNLKFISLALFFWGVKAFSAEQLNLDQYLGQVQGNNGGYISSKSSAEGGLLRSQEGNLFLTTTAFANAQITRDSRLPTSLFLLYDNIVTETLSAGVTQQTTFGLQAKLHYDLYYMYYNNPVTFLSIPGVGSGGGLIVTSYAVASPVLELSQSLWSNGFGRSTRAQVEMQEAQALASSYKATAEARNTLSQAESTYWRLALARQSVEVLKQALDRAKKIHQWNSRRARLHLGDQADEIQAWALVQSRELELRAAMNEERSASRAFNSARNLDSIEVKEQLVRLDPDLIPRLHVPQRGELRDDVKAAQQAAKATSAQAVVAREKDLPTLELYGSIALNGQNGYQINSDIGQSIGPSFSLNRPTETVGIRFSVPLDFSNLSNSRQGWLQEKIAAEKSYDRKLFEQEQQWKDLTESFEEAKSHADLAIQLEKIQLNKLTYERKRLEKGRSTTYQVLLFEQDLLLAQLNRIKDEARILNILTQLKLFGDQS